MGSQWLLVIPLIPPAATSLHQSIFSFIVIQLDVNRQWADHVELLLVRRTENTLSRYSSFSNEKQQLVVQRWQTHWCLANPECGDPPWPPSCPNHDRKNLQGRPQYQPSPYLIHNHWSWWPVTCTLHYIAFAVVPLGGHHEHGVFQCYFHPAKCCMQHQYQFGWNHLLSTTVLQTSRELYHHFTAQIKAT